MDDYQDRLQISTPEGVTVDLVLAGLGSRFTAAILDLLIKTALLLAVSVVVALLGTFGLALGFILVVVIYVGYDIVFEVFASGRTPGKRATHLRVLRADGRAIDPLSSAIRNTIRLVDGIALAYMPGMVSILVTRRNQRLGDLAARTIVVREDPAPAPAADLPPPTGEPVILAATPAPVMGPAWRWTAPGIAGPLDVSQITPQDLAALRSFLARRHDFAAEIRSDLARRLAGAVRPRVAGALDGVGDEQLIENVVYAKDVGPAY